MSLEESQSGHLGVKPVTHRVDQSVPNRHCLLAGPKSHHQLEKTDILLHPRVHCFETANNINQTPIILFGPSYYRAHVQGKI